MEHIEKLKKRPKIYCNVSDTQYEVIPTVIKEEFGWLLRYDEKDEESDIYWSDNSVPSEKLSRMKLYQKINHFPGMHVISRKNYLAWYLQRLQKILPTEYDFFPKTWVLPADAIELKKQFTNNKVFIVKPEASSQGKGIYLTKRSSEINFKERLVVQEYISPPLLISGLKFDLRVYALVAGFNPLRLFVHSEGLTRFATESYSITSLDNTCVHLTNYAVNKMNSKFVYSSDVDEDSGHKRSLASTFAHLESLNYDVAHLKNEINEIIIKTLCAASASINHVYKSCKPEDISNNMCFQVLGFDILLDANLKPWLLEVNHSPSFNTDSPLDWKVKSQVIYDTLKLVDVKARHRKKYFVEQTQKTKDRVLNGNNGKESRQQRLEAHEIAQARRDNWENKHLGNYTRIFPRDEAKYAQILEAAYEVWNDLTGRKKRAVKRDNEVTIKKNHGERKSSKLFIKPVLQNTEKAGRSSCSVDNVIMLEFPSIQTEVKKGKQDTLLGYTEQAKRSFTNNFTSTFTSNIMKKKEKNGTVLRNSATCIDLTYFNASDFVYKAKLERKGIKLRLSNPSFSTLNNSKKPFNSIYRLA